MKYFGAGLSESHKELNRIIRKPELIEQTKELFLEIHGKLHLSVVSGNERNEVDELVGDLREDEYAIMPTCLLYTSPSPRDISGSRMPSSA